MFPFIHDNHKFKKSYLDVVINKFSSEWRAYPYYCHWGEVAVSLGLRDNKTHARQIILEVHSYPHVSQLISVTHAYTHAGKRSISPELRHP